MYTNHMTDPRDTSAWTRTHLDLILIEMRHLDAVVPDTKIELYGKRFLRNTFYL